MTYRGYNLQYSRSADNSLLLWRVSNTQTNLHAHTRTLPHVYIIVRVCVCVCVLARPCECMCVYRPIRVRVLMHVCRGVTRTNFGNFNISGVCIKCCWSYFSTVLCFYNSKAFILGL